jgi:osmotically-inducible protein OsmY
LPTPEADYEIISSARAALDSDARIPTQRIKLVGSSGFIKVEGVVETTDQKTAVTRILSQLPSVHKVINNLAVLPEVPVSTIRNELLAAFRRDADSVAGRIDVKVDSGRVTLTGRVRSWRQRRIAHIAAAHVPGITEVCNELTVDVPVGVLT